MKKLLIVLACVALFLAGHAQATKSRGYNAWGGELMFAAAIPLVAVWGEDDALRKKS